jgi:SAM-dependent methyltransferase
MTVKIRKFGVKDADAYWQGRKAEDRTRERRLHRFLSNLTDRLVGGPGGRILDCGVGSGHVLRLCAQRHHVYGVELSGEAIAMSGLPADRIKQADLNEGIPDFGMRFDVVLASMLLHWLDDPSAFLCQARELLTEQGRLIVVAPNITYYRHRVAFLFGRFPPISLSHKNFQVPAETEQMFRATGLAIEEKRSPRSSWLARLAPTVFSGEIVYVLKPDPAEKAAP